MNPIHWHVLGAGAMGCLFAAGLQEAGCRVSMVRREDAAGVMKITVEGREADRNLSFATSPAGEAAPITHLLVTTKAYDVVAAVTSVVHRLDQRSQILLLANGMGFDHELTTRHSWLAPFCGTTTEGAYRVSPRHIRHTGEGRTRIGRSGQLSPPDWLSHWQLATDDCQWEPRIELALWEKLAINCAINPLTALHHCRNGELYHRPELQREVETLCNEIAVVSAAAGFSTLAATLQHRVREVIQGTADNHSSMLQDLRADRQTEIDYITGHLCKVAASLGIDAPRNRALMEEIKRLGD